MKLAFTLLALVSPFAQAYQGPINANLAGQIYLNGVTISNVICLPNGSRLKLTDHGHRDEFFIDNSECRKISRNLNYTQAALCAQLEGDLVVEITDSAIGTFQNKHVSEIR